MRRVILSVLILAAASAAAAGTFLPLHDNASWTYRNASSEEMTITTTGHSTVHGVSTIELRWEMPDQAFRNYWTTDRDGTVYLHGAHNEDGGFTAAYEPPIKWLPPSETAARCWSTSSRMYPDLEGNSSEAVPIVLEFCVTGGGLVSTPAGDFESVAISADSALPSPLSSSGYDAFGRRLDAARSVSIEWFSVDVGMVLKDEWELVSYEEITAHEDLAWGAVKTLYR